MLQILHLEDRQEDAFLIQQTLIDGGIDARFVLAKSRAEFVSALEHDAFDLILSDNTIPGFSGIDALRIARAQSPATPVICISGAAAFDQVATCLEAGARDFIVKDQPLRLVAAIRCEEERIRLRRQNHGMKRLVDAVQELSLARDLDTIMGIVRRAARELTGADGATFVLRDANERCYYAEENAISPLWKGQRFPMKTCISGWAMLNRAPAVIEDIYQDPRIPHDAYRPTFVKSLAMVPIRTEAPIGAIGNYWARRRLPTPEEVELLQALANTTAVAMENVRVYGELEQRVKDRTAQLEAANRELETFSYAVSHDLSAPLRSMRGFSDLLLKHQSKALDEKGQGWLQSISKAGAEMSQLITDLFRLSQFSKGAISREKVSLSELAEEILERLAAEQPRARVETVVAPGLIVAGDPGWLRAALENLLSNAWKYSSKVAQPRIEFGAAPQPDGSLAYYVRDNGAGFDMHFAQKLFQPFQRLHSSAEFPGSGVGLATVQRIIQRHGGTIWAEAAIGKGATFFFTLR